MFLNFFLHKNKYFSVLNQTSKAENEVNFIPNSHNHHHRVCKTKTSSMSHATINFQQTKSNQHKFRQKFKNRWRRCCWTRTISMARPYDSSWWFGFENLQWWTDSPKMGADGWYFFYARVWNWLSLIKSGRKWSKLIKKDQGGLKCSKLARNGHHSLPLGVLSRSDSSVLKWA